MGLEDCMNTLVLASAKEELMTMISHRQRASIMSEGLALESLMR